jgi:hypothetical protein
MSSRSQSNQHHITWVLIQSDKIFYFISFVWNIFCFIVKTQQNISSLLTAASIKSKREYLHSQSSLQIESDLQFVHPVSTRTLTRFFLIKYISFSVKKTEMIRNCVQMKSRQTESSYHKMAPKKNRNLHHLISVMRVTLRILRLIRIYGGGL